MRVLCWLMVLAVGIAAEIGEIVCECSENRGDSRQWSGAGYTQLKLQLVAHNRIYHWRWSCHSFLDPASTLLKFPKERSDMWVSEDSTPKAEFTCIKHRVQWQQGLRRRESLVLRKVGSEPYRLRSWEAGSTRDGENARRPYGRKMNIVGVDGLTGSVTCKQRIIPARGELLRLVMLVYKVEGEVLYPGLG